MKGRAVNRCSCESLGHLGDVRSSWCRRRRRRRYRVPRRADPVGLHDSTAQVVLNVSAAHSLGDRLGTKLDVSRSPREIPLPFPDLAVGTLPRSFRRSVAWHRFYVRPSCVRHWSALMACPTLSMSTYIRAGSSHPRSFDRRHAEQVTRYKFRSKLDP